MIHMVTGKGGVGKTTVAASLALHLSQQHKTLLVHLGESPAFGDMWRCPPLTQAPFQVRQKLHVAQWEGEGCLREYIFHFVKLEKLVSLFFDNKVMKALLGAAPALRELAILGKVTSGIRQAGPRFHYDRVVVDAFSTGHFRALLRAPVGLAEAIPYGPMGEQSRAIVRVIQNVEVFKIWVCMLPEELPVREGLELGRQLETEFGQRPGYALNRLLPDDFSEKEKVALSQEFSNDSVFRYATTEWQRRDWALSELRNVGISPQKLPQSFSSEPLSIAEELSREWLL